jgi:PII-like signaling protein
VSADCLKLTSYFGERHRADGRFVADALLDLYGRTEITASILLRGTEGFGLRHHLRSDQSLTLSEDLPLVAIAIDTRPRIEALLAETVRLNSPGLVTLERAILLDGTAAPGPIPAQAGADAKLTVYLGRQERIQRRPAFVAICDLLHRRGFAGATALLGVDGTSRGTRQRARFFSRNADVPMMVIAVGASQRIQPVIGELGALLRSPLLTVERVTVCKRDGQLRTAPQSLPGTDEHGLPLWQQLVIYTSEAGRHQGQPIHRAITLALRAAGLSGVTTLRGNWGFHGDHQPHGDGLISAARRVPAVTIVIDRPERIAAAFAIVDGLTFEHGLVTVETIPALRAAAADQHRGSLRLAAWHDR